MVSYAAPSCAKPIASYVFVSDVQSHSYEWLETKNKRGGTLSTVAQANINLDPRAVEDHVQFSEPSHRRVAAASVLELLT